jgi:hypothetical protein
MAQFNYNGRIIKYVKIKPAYYKRGWRRWAAIDPISGRILEFAAKDQEHLDIMKNACIRELGQCDFVELP